MVLFDDKPIIACSTGIENNCAIAVIRLTGFKNLIDLQSFFSTNLKRVVPRVATRTFLLDVNEEIDDILITYFKAPSSFTGEEMLELSVHGNRINVHRILSLFTHNLNIRLAQNGEFSYRAYRNKKMSFSAIEGLDAFLNAQTPLMLKQGMSLIHGELFNEYQSLHEAYLKFRSSVELSIDFSEDVGDEDAKIEQNRAFLVLSDQIKRLYFRSTQNSASLLNPSIVLAGPPNAGKSTLFNLLLKEDRAIVSPTAGTTRDYLSETISIGEANFRLIDTAGIRDIEDSIEKEGIKRARDLFSKSFFKCFLLRATELSHADEHSDEIDSSDLFLITHTDLLLMPKKEEIRSAFPKAIFVSLLSGSIEPLNESGPIGPIADSGSIEPLKKSGPIGPRNEIVKYINNSINNKYLSAVGSNPILLRRHQDVIGQIYVKMSDVGNTLKSQSDLAITSSKINNLGRLVEELVGIITPDQLLSSIFANFCIGK